MIRQLIIVLLFGALLVGCKGQPSVSFGSPANNATVASPVHLVMEAENFTIEPAGDIHDGAGHLHVMIDTGCIPAGQVVPNDDNHRHFGQGQTETDLELPAGTHTLCLQAADGAHTALDLTHTITITVP